MLNAPAERHNVAAMRSIFEIEINRENLGPYNDLLRHLIRKLIESTVFIDFSRPE